MATISIFIGAHLCTAPRPQKEAQTLAAAGHQVTVYGIWFDPELVERDRKLVANQPYRFQPLLDFRPGRRRVSLGVRSQARLSREVFRRWGVFSSPLLGYGARAMVRQVKNSSADLNIFHSEAGLWAASKLIHQNYLIGVDFEDWFSEDLLPSARKTRPVEQIRQFERTLMRGCQFKLTTSHAMASAMADEFETAPPTVIYNTFPKEDGALYVNPDPGPLKLHWFSHTIGPGRGLETLFKALPHLSTPVEIHLRGNYPDSSRRWMEPLIPGKWRSNLFIHPLVSNSELPQRIAEHDIGLALETPFCRSRNLTVTNKLFQYLQSGLAAIATATDGQKEILSQHPNVGTLVPCDQEFALAQAIESYAHDRSRLLKAKQAAFDTARKN
ncbi:MAG: glycosyltransferase, partial [Cyanobacteria bacterium P01_F01_bin.42]